MTAADVDLNEHTIWCVGKHNQYDECVRTFRVGEHADDPTLELVGLPCDNQGVVLDGELSCEQMAAAIEILTLFQQEMTRQEQVDEQLLNA